MCFITLLLLVTLFLRLVLRFSTRRFEYAILLFLQLYLQPFQKKIIIYLSLQNSIFFFSHPHAHHDDTLSLRPHPQTSPPPLFPFCPCIGKKAGTRPRVTITFGKKTFLDIDVIHDANDNSAVRTVESILCLIALQHVDVFTVLARRETGKNRDSSWRYPIACCYLILLR